MQPRFLAELPIRPAAPLRADEPLGKAARDVLESALPAQPVVDANGRRVGLFGEREFIEAIFPGYLRELSTARFVRRSLEEQLEKRSACLRDPVSEHMNTEDIWVPADFSDVEVAETFLHHRVLIVPVLDDGRPVGVVTRTDFFRALVAGSGS